AQVIQDSTGVYHADVPATIVGTYSYRWEGTGTVVAVAEGSFTVTSAYPTSDPAAGVGSYADLATFRQYIRTDPVANDADDPDSLLEKLALDSAARAIDRACGRNFAIAGTTPSARVFTPKIVPGASPLEYLTREYPYTWYTHFVLSIDDITDLSGMMVAFDATGDGDYTNAITGFRVSPQNAPAKGLPYRQLTFDVGIYPPFFFESVQVTALWGWGACPATIINANLLQASRYFKRRDAPFGVAGSPQEGSELRLLSKLDPDVALMVGAYKRNWGAVTDR
ncbi:MAG: hypothetical protein ACREMY_10740, partial [bacterium]